MSFEKCSPFRCLLALSLVAALAAGLAELCAAQEAPDANFYFYLRPRLGHLGKTDEFVDAYEEYFENVIRHDDRSLKSISDNDWRRGRPTGKQCVVFLQDFQVRNYKLSKPYDVLILDACLEWILADPKEVDSEKKMDYDLLDVESRGEADELAADTKLREIYTSTRFQKWPADVPEEVQQKLHGYLSRLLKINADNPKNWCHSLWMEAYNDFIEELYLSDCEHPSDGCKFYGIEGSEKDAYLKLIAESTTNNLKTCYNVVQKQMVGIMRKDYQEKSGLNLFVTSGAAKQAKRMRWGQEMVKILQIASGTSPKDPVQLSDVVIDLNNIKYEDEETIERFTNELGKFALSNVNLKESQDDEKGLKRYRKAMTKLCLPYINPKEFFKTVKTIELAGEQDPNRKPFEFYNLIYNLIRMTNHQQLIGISKTQFEEDVLQKGWVPLYLTTFACQIISTTWGTIDYTENEEAFAVSLRPNAQVLIEDWPIDLLVERLAEDEPAPQADDEFEEDEEADNEVEIVYRKSATTRKPAASSTTTTTTKRPKNIKIKAKSSPAPKGGLPQPAVPEGAGADEEPAAPPTKSSSSSMYKGLKKLVPKWASSSDKKSSKSQAQHHHHQPIQQIIHQVVNIPEGAKSVIKQYAHQSNGAGSHPHSGHQTVAQHIEIEAPAAKKPAAPSMSLETIKMFHKLHGRLPKLEPVYFQMYPELVELRDGKLQPAVAPKPEPAAPAYSQPAARFDGAAESAASSRYGNNYGPPSGYSAAAPDSARYGHPEPSAGYGNSEFMYNTRANHPAAPYSDQRPSAGYTGYNEPPAYMRNEFGGYQGAQEFGYNRGAPMSRGPGGYAGFERPGAVDPRAMQPPAAAANNKASSLFF